VRISLGGRGCRDGDRDREVVVVMVRRVTVGEVIPRVVWGLARLSDFGTGDTMGSMDLDGHTWVWTVNDGVQERLI
jgi:hypothetical protein